MTCKWPAWHAWKILRGGGLFRQLSRIYLEVTACPLMTEPSARASWLSSSQLNRVYWERRQEGWWKPKEIVQSWWPRKWPARTVHSSKLHAWEQSSAVRWERALLRYRDSHLNICQCRRHSHELKIIFTLRSLSTPLIFLILHSDLLPNVSPFYNSELYNEAKEKNSSGSKNEHFHTIYLIKASCS